MSGDASPGRADWARVAALFDELVDATPADRAARLAAIAEAEPTLATELESLLRADEEADGGLLDRSAPAAGLPIHAVFDGGLWRATPGLELGPFRLSEPLGEGGMGEVWRAERIDGEYQQSVAIKVLKRGLDTDAILRRFLQERRILARLEHSTIVRLLDGGTTPDGRPWYAMECIDGQPIDRHARAAALDARERIALVAEVADAVAYAHARLVVHRDLKPANVLVTADGRPKLLDFGIAKMLEATAGETLTGTATRVLSPAYAAPEQILGEPVGTATDVYALAVMLYELLTGTLPHDRRSLDLRDLAGRAREDGGETRASQLIRRLSAAELASLYGRPTEPGRVLREVAGDLDLVMAVALRADPSRRHQSVAAFAADLRACLDGRPVSVRADSVVYRARRFVRRHAGGVTAAALVLVALVGGLGTALWQAQVARAALAEAEAATAQARAQAEAATAMQTFLVRSFGTTTPTLARDGANLNLGDFVEATLARLGEELTLAPSARLELRSQLAQVLMQMGRHEAAIEELGRVLAEHREGHVQLPHSSLATALHDRAMLHVRAKEFAPARALVVEALHALDQAESAGAEVAPLRLAIRTTQSIIATDTGDYTLGLEVTDAILRDRIVVNGIKDHRSAVDYLNRCVALAYLARYAEAAPDCDHAETLLLAEPSAPRARIAWIRNAQAMLLRDQRRHDEALRVIEEGLAVVQQYLGAEHPIGISLSSTRVRALTALGRLDEALALDDAITGSSTYQAEPARHRLNGALRRARILTQLGRADEALDLLEAATAAEPASPALPHLRARHALAALRLIQGDSDGAHALADALLPDFDRAGLPVHDERALLLLTRADIEVAAGRANAADPLRDEAAAILAAVFGENSPRVGEALGLSAAERLAW